MSRKNSSSIEYIKGKASVVLLTPGASPPSKEEGRETDSSYDITLISRTDNRGDDVAHEVNTFKTGIALSPPCGYYFELVAKSSLYRHGYMLATGVSIIEPSYTGELIVPLYKYKETEDIELPLKAVQIVLRPAIYSFISLVKTLTPTNRGDTGFNSSDYDRPYASETGVYIPDPQSAMYNGDMQAYDSQVKNYSKGQKRPQSAPKQKNHMF